MTLSNPKRDLFIDIETYCNVDLKNTGLWRYAQADSLEVLLLAYAYDDEPVQIVDLKSGEPLPDQLVADILDERITKHAFNASFELACLKRLIKVKPEQWHCDMIHARYLNFYGSLADVGSALKLPAELLKHPTGAALIRTFSIPVKPTAANGQKIRILPQDAPDKWEQFKEYCKQDVEAERAIYNKLKDIPVPDSEQALWALDFGINARGVKVDRTLLKHALEITDRYRKNQLDRLLRITRLANPMSRTQMLAWINQQEELNAESLAAPKLPEVKAALTKPETKEALPIYETLNKTSVAKYTCMADCIGVDGRIRGLFSFYGASTGRWAGRLVQVQNLPRPDVGAEEVGRLRIIALKNPKIFEAVTGDPIHGLKQLIRTAFIPSDNSRFIVADFSAIEARVIAWLAGEKWRQDVFATHGKIYEASAAQMFNVPIETIKHGGENYHLRAKGKVAELALGFGGGVNALKAMGADRMGLKPDELLEIVSKWRKASPSIVKLWNDCDGAFRAAIEGETRRIRGLLFSREQTGGITFVAVKLPSGRSLYYPNPSLIGGEAVYRDATGTAKKIYGGKLVENVVQAIARDCLAETLERLAVMGLAPVMHVHDEVVIDTDRSDITLEDVLKIMSSPIPWAEGLVLSGAGFEGSYYRKD